MLVIYVYYEKYAPIAIRNAKKIALTLNMPLTILLHGRLKNRVAKTLRSEDNVIEVNSQNEFEAWVTYIKQFKFLNQNNSCATIFCNDTFCTHHPWSASNIKFIREALEHICDVGVKTPAIAGDVCEIPGEIEVFGKKSKKWVSTYFFITNELGCETLISEHEFLRERIENTAIGIPLSELYRFTDQRGNIFISEWLTQKGGWYKALVASELEIGRKCAAIIEEINFSFSILKRNGVLIDASRRTETATMFRRISQYIENPYYLLYKIRKYAYKYRR